MRSRDWSSDVCSSDLERFEQRETLIADRLASLGDIAGSIEDQRPRLAPVGVDREPLAGLEGGGVPAHLLHRVEHQAFRTDQMEAADALLVRQLRSEAPTSEIQSLMRITAAVLRSQKKHT